MKAEFRITFGEQGYIALPYWPEIDRIINLKNAAGVHFKHAPAKQRELIETYCKDNGVPIAEFDAWEYKVANDKWYRDKNSNIVVARHQLQGAIVQALHPKQSRMRHRLSKSIPREQVRTLIAIRGDLSISPTKEERDSIYEHYIKHEKTNQRRLQRDEVITNFSAEGIIEWADVVAKSEDIESLLRWTGENVGVGSARIMGCGRFELCSFAVLAGSGSKVRPEDTVFSDPEESADSCSE